MRRSSSGGVGDGSERGDVVFRAAAGTSGPAAGRRCRAAGAGRSARRTPTAGSPRPGTGTRSPAAPGSAAGRRTSRPAWRWWRGPAAQAGRKPYSGRPASAESRRPTTRIAELDTMRRSTSLAVCCAPIRMMPSDRPRSAMSSSTSLIGELPSRGAYLFSSSIIVNSRPPGPASSLRAVSAASTTPTTNRCARSCRLCRSTTVTCWSWVEMRAARRRRPGRRG